MDVGADAAGQVISLAGQVFKIGMEGMVVVVKIAGKGAAHAAALLAAALSGKKKTKGKVMLRNMLRDSKGITLFTLKESDLKKFAKEAKAYNVRYCIVKEKKQDRADGNIDMFIRAEDAAVVNRIIERFGLTAVKQDVSIEGAPEAERVESEPAKDEDYVYGDITISREANSLVDEAGETETQIKTRVPGTYGKNVRYVYFDKAGLREVHGGKSYKAHIEPEGSYELYNEAGAVAETVSGEKLLTHYDRKDNEVIPGNSKARTASEAQSGKSYSAWEDKAEETGLNPSVSPDKEKQPDYVYGDVTISREVNSLVEEESEKQIKTRVPGTFGKDVRYVYFDKAGLEETHGGKSYKAHIEPEKKYELYNKAGAVAETVYGEELLTHYDRKDKDKDDAPENQEAVKTETSPKAASEKSYEDAVHEGSKNAEVPDTKNRFNRFSQRTYDFDAMEKELLSNNEPLKSAGDVKPDKSSERGQEPEPAPEENPVAADGTVKTNPKPEPVDAGTAESVEKYDVLTVNEEGEISAYSLNEETFYNEDRNGMTVLRDTKLPRSEPRSEAEMRPSVRDKLSGYKKEEQDNALERQIKAAEAKRERESRRLEREGGDVLPEQRAKMESYTKSRDEAMADFLSDAKLPERR